MNISHIRTVKQMKEFMEKNQEFKMFVKNKEEVYEWLQKTLVKVKYLRISKKEKGVVLRYIKQITQYSGKQIKRLVRRYKETGVVWKKWQRNTFSQKYTARDIALLHEVDLACEGMSGNAVQKILQRNYEVFELQDYKNLAEISVSHIYNLRKSQTYKNKGGVSFDNTQYTPVNIGKRMKPHPKGKPGYFRVDTVHQGDKNGKKGIYHINFVDEVLQFQFVFSVPAISQKYMKQVLEMLYTQCPYIIINFHSDNGSEFINETVASILQSLHIKQTKSRARRHNDNALVESKNGAVIRKHFGYFHIPATKDNAAILNNFHIQWFIPYLNFHRPCAYAQTTVDHKGKKKKKYKDYDTPYERLKALDEPDQYLRRNFSFALLDSTAYRRL